MKDIPTSPRIIEIRHKRRIRKIRLFFLFFILLISIIMALSILSTNSHIIINKVVVTGTHVINQEEIEKEVNKDISGKYFYLFSKANSFIYPQKNIYNNLRLDFPRIELLNISRGNLNTLNIDITERTGISLYCGDNIPISKDQVGENCYFINNDGFIFDTAPYFSGNIYFKYYVGLGSNITDPLGKQMMDIDRFHEIQRFIDLVSSLGFKPIYLALDQDNAYSLYLNPGVNGNPPRIIFNNDNDLKATQDNLSLAINKKEFADEINSKYNALLYIDLRFKNKVLYKFQ